MAKSGAVFGGFDPEGIAFLANLGRNNNKAWFESHRAIYERAIVTPALRFVESMDGALRAIAPSVRSEPKVGGSLFRIHRDTRFSVDQRPYKTHVGIRFRDGDTATSSKCTGPLFYVEFDARRLRLGVGVKEFGPEALAHYRRAVARRRVAKEIERVVEGAREAGHTVLGDLLARVPAAYSDQADNELLKRKGLFVLSDAGLPTEIFRAEFVEYCADWFAPHARFFGRLRRIALGAV